jgi:hypothetical protein
LRRRLPNASRPWPRLCRTPLSGPLLRPLHGGRQLTLLTTTTRVAGTTRPPPRL